MKIDLSQRKRRPASGGRNLFFIFISLLIASNIYAQDNDTTYKMGEGYHISHWGTEKDPQTLDVDVFRFINSKRSTFKDNFLPVVNSSFMAAIVTVPLGMIIYGASAKSDYDQNTGFLLTVAQMTNFGITFGMKNFSSRIRPYLSLRNVYYRLILAESLYSFPSGHASHSFCLATMFLLRYANKPYIYLPLYAWALTICYGRSYFGLHYPVDLIGGITIGTLSSILVYSMRTQILKFLRGKDVRDENEPPSPEATTASFLLSSAANTFVSPVFKGHGLSFSPFMNNNGAGLGFSFRW
jgi:undecaprenyl-diphosphatase